MKRLNRPPPLIAALLALAASGACCSLAAEPARADAQADAVLARAKAAYKDAKSLSANISMTISQDAQKTVQAGTVRLRKPNLARIELTDPQKVTVMADGKEVVMLLQDKQYIKQAMGAGGTAQAEALAGLPGSLFFGHESYGFGVLSGAAVTKKYSGKKTVGGVAYDVVTVTGKTPFVHTVTIYIGADGLISRTDTELTLQSRTMKQLSEWTAQKLNSVPAAASFAIVLPKGAVPFKQPAQPDYAAKLVAVGKPAPVFAVPSPAGGSVSLTESTADHKAVLVNFWFYG